MRSRFVRVFVGLLSALVALLGILQTMPGFRTPTAVAQPAKP